MNAFTQLFGKKNPPNRLQGRDYSVVVPILNPNMAEGLVKLAASLAGASLEGVRRHIRIVVLGIVTVPDDTPLSQGAPLVRAYRTMLRYIPQNGELDENVEVHTEVRVARAVWQGIADQVKEEEGDLLLMHWKGSTQTPGKVYGDTIDALMDDPPCDVVLARFSNSLPAIKQILLPVRGGSYSTLALGLVSNLAEEWQANITVLHNLGNNSGAADSFRSVQSSAYNLYADSYDEDESLSTLQALALELPPHAKLVAMQGKLIQSIIQEAHHHDLIVVGASETKESKTEQGSNEKLAEKIARETRRPILVVKTAKPFELTRPSPGMVAAPVFKEPDLQESVDRWFAENTFRYREFRTMSSLTLLKDRHHLRISLILPVYGNTHPVALSEYVRRAWFALFRDCALVDEILVSDPDKRLDQAEVAAFYQSGPGHGRLSENEIIYIAPGNDEEYSRPGRGNDLGPGEAIWLALKKARGDLIVWADPTMDNFEARLIYGLVGPLLTYPEFQLTGGFYSESGESGEQTSNPVNNSLVELGIRPLLGGFFPKLAGVIDPICTVGAARRELLERLPLFSGPAFITGLLLDTVVRNDLMSVAQVDLGPKPAASLTIPPQLITADVMAILLRRAEERSQNTLWTNFDPAIKTIQKSGDVYSLKVEQPESLLNEFPPVDYTAGYVRHYFEPEFDPESE